MAKRSVIRRHIRWSQWIIEKVQGILESFEERDKWSLVLHTEHDNEWGIVPSTNHSRFDQLSRGVQIYNFRGNFFILFCLQ